MFSTPIQPDTRASIVPHRGPVRAAKVGRLDVSARPAASIGDVAGWERGRPSGGASPVAIAHGQIRVDRRMLRGVTDPTARSRVTGGVPGNR
jgi:hypothetical protein